MKKVLYGLMFVAILGLVVVSVPALAVVGNISINNLTDLGEGDFTSSGTWDTVQNQPCWNNGNGFRYFIEVIEDANNNGDFDGGEIVLQTLDPAPCNGDFSDPVDADEGSGGIWPGNEQPFDSFHLDAGEHFVCAVLLHQGAKGGDIVGSPSCLDNPVVVYACSDGEDNDEDNLTDYPNDPGCDSPEDENEINEPDPETSTVTLCKENNLENSLSGWTLSLGEASGATGDNGCVVLEDVLYGNYTIGETLQAGWVNVSGLGGVAVNDPTETFTVVNRELAICEDGLDNDNDGKIDFVGENPDPGCASASDDNETDPIISIPGCTDENASNYNPDATTNDGSCVYTVTICKYDAQENLLSGWNVYVSDGETNYGGITGDNGCVQVLEVSPDTYTLGETLQAGWANVSGVGASAVVDGVEDVFNLVNRELAVCEDGLDNDNDGKIDFASENPDPGCASASDDNETDPLISVPGCTDPDATNFNPDATTNDGSCEYPEIPPACSDDSDNDDDNLTDYPSDPGCDSPEDNDETNDEDNSNRSRSSGSRAPQGEVLGAATEICSVVDTYMRRGYRNVADEVQTLQNFLNSYMQSGLVVDSAFGPATEAAVKAFQVRQRANVMDPWGLTAPTGIFYKTSLAEAKRIMCPETFGTLPIPTDLIPWSQNPGQVPARAN